jgi:hypothetical protein
MTNAVHFPTYTTSYASDDRSTYQNTRVVGRRARTLAFLGMKRKNKESVAVSDNPRASRYVYPRIPSLRFKGFSPPTESRPLYGIDFVHPSEDFDSRDDDDETFDSDSLRSCSFPTVFCPHDVRKCPVPKCPVPKRRPKLRVIDEPLSFNGHRASDEIDCFRCDESDDENNAMFTTTGVQLEMTDIEGCDMLPPPSTRRFEPPRSPHREDIFFLGSFFDHDASPSTFTTGPSATELDEFGEEWEMSFDDEDPFGQFPRWRRVGDSQVRMSTSDSLSTAVHPEGGV